jgi:hypothetical protein
MNNPIQIPNLAKSFFKNQNINSNSNSGTCYKPRYSYVNNANDNGLLEGLIPGIVGDVIDMNPGNFINMLDGNAIPGSTDISPPRFQLLPCIAEQFIGSKNIQSFNILPLLIWAGILLFIIIQFS